MGPKLYTLTVHGPLAPFCICPLEHNFSLSLPTEPTLLSSLCKDHRLTTLSLCNPELLLVSAEVSEVLNTYCLPMVSEFLLVSAHRAKAPQSARP